MNTTEFLTIASAIVPDRVATIFEEQRMTFAGLQERANRLANALAGLGTRPGDRIAIMQVNCNQSIETYFASARLDAIYVPINFRSRTEELAQMLAITRPNALFIGQQYLPLIETLDAASLPSHIVVLDGQAAEGKLSYNQLLAATPADDLHSPEGDAEDTTVIIFTAGTTGTPKGVMLTHNSFSSYMLANVSSADPEVEETNLLTVPLYHIAGLQAAMAGIYGGRTLVIMRQFEPLQWLSLVQTHRAHRAMLVPTMLKRLIDHPQFRDFDLSSLEVITYGAAPMPLEVIKQAIKEFPGVRFINAFGQTETASTITMLPPENHILEGSPEEIEKKLRHLSSIGRPLEDVEVRIVSEDGRPGPLAKKVRSWLGGLE